MYCRANSFVLVLKAFSLTLFHSCQSKHVSITEFFHFPGMKIEMKCFPEVLQPLKLACGILLLFPATSLPFLERVSASECQYISLEYVARDHEQCSFPGATLTALTSHSYRCTRGHSSPLWLPLRSKRSSACFSAAVSSHHD